MQHVGAFLKHSPSLLYPVQQIPLPRAPASPLSFSSTQGEGLALTRSPVLCCKPEEDSTRKCGHSRRLCLLFQRPCAACCLMSETTLKGTLGGNSSVKVRSGSPALRIPENGLERKAGEFWQRKRCIRGPLVGSSGSFWLGPWSWTSGRSWLQCYICTVMALGERIYY